MRFDYIVIGAGSAGCAVAARIADARLSETVALIEAGPTDENVLVRTPFMAAILFSTPNRWNWFYYTVPQKGLNGRRSFQPRGRGLGGCSSINAMIYIRGHHQDYDDWANAGCTGWGWQDVLPYFRRAENNAFYKNEWHGTEGPLYVEDFPAYNPFTNVYIEAAKQCGYEFNEDFNGATQEGIGYYQLTAKQGERWNSARAYIHSKPRKNLVILNNTQVQRILFENQRAVGVEAARGWKKEKIFANSEIILCGGAFHSPQLLMCSGIGPADHLKSFNIPIIYNAPMVGKNLQDHINISLLQKINSPLLFGFNSRTVLNLIRGIFEYRKNRTGIFSTTHCESGAFIKTSPSLVRPDIQLHFETGLNDHHLHRPHFSSGISLYAGLLRPKSRGEVLLASHDMHKKPLIDPRYFAESEDLEALLKGVKIAHKILSAPSFQAFKSKALYFDNINSDDEWREFIRKYADTIYHPVGTCRMGSEIEAVVDPKLRVNGVECLRVIDASIMPTIVGGNTNAPTIMIGEKGADLIINGK